MPAVCYYNNFVLLCTSAINRILYSCINHNFMSMKSESKLLPRKNMNIQIKKPIWTKNVKSGPNIIMHPTRGPEGTRRSVKILIVTNICGPKIPSSRFTLIVYKINIFYLFSRWSVVSCKIIHTQRMINFFYLRLLSYTYFTCTNKRRGNQDYWFLKYFTFCH